MIRAWSESRYPKVEGEQLEEDLSTRIELDPCSSHEDLYGQLITKKLQHRRYFTINRFIFSYSWMVIIIHQSQIFICFIRCKNSPQILMLNQVQCPCKLHTSLEEPSPHQTVCIVNILYQGVSKHWESSSWCLLHMKQVVEQVPLHGRGKPPLSVPTSLLGERHHWLEQLQLFSQRCPWLLDQRCSKGLLFGSRCFQPWTSSASWLCREKPLHWPRRQPINQEQRWRTLGFLIILITIMKQDLKEVARNISKNQNTKCQC